MYTCIDKTMQIVLERGSIDARVLSTGGGGGGQGGSFPPKMSIFPPKHFHKIWQNTTEWFKVPTSVFFDCL